jgi:hypothetical protein
MAGKYHTYRRVGWKKKIETEVKSLFALACIAPLVDQEPLKDFLKQVNDMIIFAS